MITYHPGCALRKAQIYSQLHVLDGRDVLILPALEMKLIHESLPELLEWCRAETIKMFAIDQEGWELTEFEGRWTASVLFYPCQAL